MIIASFDIGKKNFAFCVQSLELPAGEGLTEEEIVRLVVSSGAILHLENLDLTQGCRKDRYLDPRTFENMTGELNARRAIWDTCDAFVVEQQLSYKRARNPMALKLGQHCMSYFWITYHESGKRVVEFPSYHKSQILGAPAVYGTITKTYKNGNTREIKDNVKRWAIRRALEILEERGSPFLTVLQGSKKKDDLSDCILHGAAYVALLKDPSIGRRNRRAPRKS